MNSLQEFKITKLFGYKNVHLKFENDTLILMGENGIGKTSILNALYFTLTRKWEKLLKINFRTIYLKVDNREFSFSKEVLNSFNEIIKNDDTILDKDILKRIIESIDLEDLQKEIQKQINSNIYKEYIDTRAIIHHYLRQKRYHLEFEVTTRHLVEMVYLLCKDNNFKTLYEFINYGFNTPILYFPTYRRVEEELQNLGRFDVENRYRRRLFVEDREQASLEEETLIQFGMKDVEERIEKRIIEIKESSALGFSKVSGDILKQLQAGFPKVDISKIIKEDIQIILNRIQNRNLPSADKDKILKLLDSGKINTKPELAYFLIKLQEIYAEQKELDDAIKGFKDVVNEYLVDKLFVFDESNVTLKIFNKNNSKEVKLSQLSSGEKQIVSLFSKIYLENESNFMVLFDEPELSLSIKWQRQLLPHIINSKKCAFLLAVTHSPFIFQNELENYVIGLNTFID